MLRTQQLPVTEDYSEPALVRSPSRKPAISTCAASLPRANRLSQRALSQAAQQYQTSIPNLQESHWKAVSNPASINYRGQSKLQATNLALVADKQRPLFERSSLDRNDSVPGMFSPIRHIRIASLTDDNCRFGKPCADVGQIVTKTPNIQDFDYPPLCPLARIHCQHITELAATYFGKAPGM